MSTLYTLELDCYTTSSPKMYVYAQGVSPFFIRLDILIHTKFRIKKHWLVDYELKKLDITYYFLLFQRLFRKRLRWRRAFRLLKLRQTGEISPRQFMNRINRPE
jgi:hypothetical protein